MPPRPAPDRTDPPQNTARQTERQPSTIDRRRLTPRRAPPTVNVHDGRENKVTESMTQPFRWAVLGPGRIAARFASQLPHSSAGVLHAVGSTDPMRAQTFAAEHAPASRGGQVSTGDYTEVLADPDVDAVYVSTVHTTHARLALAAIAQGKHVLCEKPMTPHHSSTMAVVDAARARGVTLLEAYMYRFHPQTSHVLSLVADGAIGDLVHIDGSFSYASGDLTGRSYDPDLAGGGILDVGGYPASYAHWIVGAALGQPYAEPVDLSAAGTIGETGVDEWSVARLTFAGGITASARTGVGLAEVNSVTIYGSRGVIYLPDPWTLTETPELTLTVAGTAPATHAFPGAHSYALEADALHAGVTSGEVVEHDSEGTLSLARTLDQWREQIGLSYPFEADDANIPTVSGDPLVADQRQMTYGELPGISKKASRLVMGCDNQLDLTHASAMFDHFVSIGGTTFDTAWLYGGGKIERLFGQWMANRGLREDLVVITKGAHTPHCTPEAITWQLHESLERQQTDYADLYMMHRDNEEVPVGEFVDVLDGHVRAGRIRSFGGSNWSTARIDEANAYAEANGRHHFTALSNHFGLAEALDVPWQGCRHVTDAASKQWLRERQIPLLPWSSQARGFFTGRADPEDRSDAELVRCYYSDDNFERLRRAEELAATFGVSATAIALAFVLHQPFPTFPLIGPRTIAETRSSLAGVALQLSPEQIAWLDLTDGGAPAPTL